MRDVYIHVNTHILQVGSPLLFKSLCLWGEVGTGWVANAIFSCKKTQRMRSPYYQFFYACLEAMLCSEKNTELSHQKLDLDPGSTMY